MFMLQMDGNFGAPVRKPAPKPASKPAPVIKRAAAAPKPAPKPAAKSKPTPDAGVTKLQHTLNSLAQRTGDSALSLKVDGLIGPKTAAATNRAFVKYGAAVGAPPEVRTGRLTPANVLATAGDLAFFVEKMVDKSLPKASPAQKKAVEQKQAAVKKKAAATRSDAIIALQRAVRTLGVIVEDGALALTIDGLIGPKTTAATNRALSRYVQDAPPLLATGSLSQDAVVSAAAAITELVIAEAKRRQATPASQRKKPVTSKSKSQAPDALPRITIPAPYSTAPEPAEVPEPSQAPPVTIPQPYVPPPAPAASPTPAPVVPDQVLPPGERDITTAPKPAPEVKPFPWPWVIAGGAGVIGLVAVTVLIARKKKR
jgi:pilus assembly protein FimV